MTELGGQPSPVSALASSLEKKNKDWKTIVTLVKSRRVPRGTRKEEKGPSLCSGLRSTELGSREGRVKGQGKAYFPGAMLWEASSH